MWKLIRLMQEFSVSYKYLKSTALWWQINFNTRCSILGSSLHVRKQNAAGISMMFISRSLDFQCKMWNKYANQGIKDS